MIGTLIIALALTGLLLAQEDDLTTRVWQGVQEAQAKYTTGCGTITEVRTSKLLLKPLILHGKFCAAGLTRFALEYSEPDVIRVRFNEDYLNVSTGPGGKNTEVLQVGNYVRRTQGYFSKDNSIENLKRNFDITVRQDGPLYEMKLVPRTERFRARVNHVIVKLARNDFLLRSLEVDGKSGVRSVFAIQITSLNSKIDESMFRVYKPK